MMSALIDALLLDWSTHVYMIYFERLAAFDVHHGVQAGFQIREHYD